jgi:hypothetical protein
MPQQMINVFRALKSKSLINANVTFYIVRRKLVNREAHYDISLINAEEKLRRKLRSNVINAIANSNNVIEYNYETSDLDDNVLGIETTCTDFKSIIDKIIDGEIPSVRRYEEILETFFYIIRLDFDNTRLFAVRKTSETWKAKKVSHMANTVFHNNQLIDIDKSVIFPIDSQVDFFSFHDTIFIANKKNFETVLNFRAGMEKNRDAFVNLITPLNYFANPNDIATFVGDNSYRLRKLAQLKNAGYYTNRNFVMEMIQLSITKNWDLNITGNNLITVTEQNIDLVLRLLNNDRLESMINHEEFNVDVKHRV